MLARKPITIVGGGLAGLTLGIGLRQHQVPTLLLEAGHYPRHRVCGEFICGQGESTLAKLGLIPLLEQAGARRTRTVSLFTMRARSGIRRLPQPGLCLSRYCLDAALADEFRRLGGKLEVETRWLGDRDCEGFVYASGRRRADFKRPNAVWFGLKAHVRGIKLQSDLELHLNPDGYIGLCHLNSDVVNVCGLFRRIPREATVCAGKYDQLLARMGPELRRRLQSASVEESSICSVAALSYDPPAFADAKACRIGDCLTLTPPLTGNGMSMAFEAAELAVQPLTQYSQGLLGWAEAVRAVSAACRKRFGQRLAWSRALHPVVFHHTAQRGFGFLIFRFDSAWRLAFALTR